METTCTEPRGTTCTVSLGIPCGALNQSKPSAGRRVSFSALTGLARAALLWLFTLTRTAFGMYAFVGFLMDGPGAVAVEALGLQLVPTFDAPWLVRASACAGWVGLVDPCSRGTRLVASPVQLGGF